VRFPLLSSVSRSGFISPLKLPTTEDNIIPSIILIIPS